MKFVEMRQWVPEAINTPQENEILIAGMVKDLKGCAPGQYAVSVGGDTLIFATLDEEGTLCLYECTIRRATANLTEENLPEGCVPTARSDQRPS